MMKNIIKLIGLFVLILSFSCTNEALEVDFQTLNEVEIKQSMDLDTDLAFIEELEVQVFEDHNLRNSQLPDCVTVTVVMQQNFKEITLDFGDGCEVNGKFLAGIMIITFEPDPNANQREITTVFDNFTINQRTINGVKNRLWQASNDNGNPQHTITVDITVNWLTTDYLIHRTGTKVRERVEGEQGIWTTYVFNITGQWTNTFGNGNTYSWEILTPLVKEAICYFFVSGNVEIERPNVSGVLDYGNGECDNLAIFTTSNGEVIEISLD